MSTVTISLQEYDELRDNKYLLKQYAEKGYTIWVSRWHHSQITPDYNMFMHAAVSDELFEKFAIADLKRSEELKEKYRKESEEKSKTINRLRSEIEELKKAKNWFHFLKWIKI